MLINIVRMTALFVGYFMLIAILIELVSLILLHYFRLGSNTTKELRRTDLINPLFKKNDSYSIHDTWRQQYYKEIDEIFNSSNQALNKWQPLGQWSAPRYHGKCINIDKYNLRRTIDTAKKNFEQSDKFRICFFGGSLVWGWEVRDESTIPSRLLSFRNGAIVENHGQLGYVSSQSVIAFIQRIKHEPKPNVIVFVDGLNDVYSAHQSGIAGIEQNAFSKKQRFESKNLETIPAFYRKKSNFIQLMLSFLRDKKTKDKGNFENLNEALAYSVIAAYNQNVLLVDKIASAHNFKAIFIWPPTLFDKTHLTKYEAKLLDKLSFCQPLYSCVKKIIKNENILSPKVINLSNIFYQNKEPMYVDPWHYNERANCLIAEKIHELIPSALDDKIETMMSEST